MVLYEYRYILGYHHIFMGQDPTNVCHGSEITNSLNGMQPLGISSTLGNIAIKYC
jgi:hypothetical protein